MGRGGRQSTDSWSETAPAPWLKFRREVKNAHDSDSWDEAPWLGSNGVEVEWADPTARIVSKPKALLSESFGTLLFLYVSVTRRNREPHYCHALDRDSGTQ